MTALAASPWRTVRGPYRHRDRCRICDGRTLIKFLTLGMQPLANRFLDPGDLDEPEPVFPLEVYFCGGCNLVQLADVVDKRELFTHYVYFSSGMPTLPQHFQRYADEVVERFAADPSSLVVEVGSNDGLFLRAVQARDVRVLGVDPAVNVAQRANEVGVETLNDFFSGDVARQIAETRGRASAIVANNVVAHIDDHHDLADGVAALLSDDGVFVFEAPYVGDMIEELTYDTVYHEHLSYLALRPLMRLFLEHGLEIFDVRFFPVQGLSIRVYVGKRGVRAISAEVERVVAHELANGFDRLGTYERLARAVAASKEKLVTLLRGLKRQGHVLAAYGAPAKGNTVLNYCGIGRDILDFATDDLPSKQGLFTPGSRIPVVPSSSIAQRDPSHLLLLAWNYADVILDKERRFRERGGKFISPVRGVQIL